MFAGFVVWASAAQFKLLSLFPSHVWMLMFVPALNPKLGAHPLLLIIYYSLRECANPPLQIRHCYSPGGAVELTKNSILNLCVRGGVLFQVLEQCPGADRVFVTDCSLTFLICGLYS